MSEDLRDPRAFKVHNEEIGFPKDDDVLVAIARGDKPQGYKVETYRAGQTIPAGRFPRSAVSVFVARGYVEPIERTAAPNKAAAPVAPAAASAPRRMDDTTMAGAVGKTGGDK